MAHERSGPPKWNDSVSPTALDAADVLRPPPAQPVAGGQHGHRRRPGPAPMPMRWRMAAVVVAAGSSACSCVGMGGLLAGMRSHLAALSRYAAFRLHVKACGRPARRRCVRAIGSIGVSRPRAPSITAAASRAVSSAKRSAVRSTPTGRPSTRPAGTHADGRPRTLAGMTGRMSSSVCTARSGDDASQPLTNGSWVHVGVSSTSMSANHSAHSRISALAGHQDAGVGGEVQRRAGIEDGVEEADRVGAHHRGDHPAHEPDVADDEVGPRRDDVLVARRRRGDDVVAGVGEGVGGLLASAPRRRDRCCRRAGRRGGRRAAGDPRAAVGRGGVGTECGSRRSRPARMPNPRRTSATVRAIGPSTGISWNASAASTPGIVV